MICQQFDIWLADLNPRRGTEAGKIRPVLIIQTNLLNSLPHLSTLICPITTNTTENASVLRISLTKGIANLHQDCDIMIDQIRAIDNKRLLKKLGTLPVPFVEQVKKNILLILDIY
jgi:mRNA interferase MazF